MDASVKTDFLTKDSPAHAKPFFLFRRPTAKTGLVGWLTTVDHKKIGLLYGIFALSFFLIGGIEALIIRAQLAIPGNDLVSPQKYNELMTMHGTTMIFLAIMPLSAAFFNYMVPLMIGARDVAFPRLNAFSLWCFAAGAIIINTGWILKSGAPDIGWFGYAPLTSNAYGNQVTVNGDISTDLWILGLQILGVASMAASLNFIVTIIKKRPPGMT
jgi:cytochrome c oxidase subunit 1